MIDAGLLSNIRMIYDAMIAAGEHFHCTNYGTTVTAIETSESLCHDNGTTWLIHEMQIH